MCSVDFKWKCSKAEGCDGSSKTPCTGPSATCLKEEYALFSVEEIICGKVCITPFILWQGLYYTTGKVCTTPPVLFLPPVF